MLAKHEKVLISLWLTKINNKDKMDKRAIAITNRRILAIKKSIVGIIDVKRQTPIGDV
jgi:hypothetical protein